METIDSKQRRTHLGHVFDFSLSQHLAETVKKAVFPRSNAKGSP